MRDNRAQRGEIERGEILGNVEQDEDTQERKLTG